MKLMHHIIIWVPFILFTINLEVKSQDKSSFGVGYTYMSEVTKGGFYINLLSTFENKWGYVSNLDFFTVEDISVTFADANVSYNITGLSEFQILPYAGIAIGTIGDGEYDENELDIDALRFGLSYGIAGVYYLNKISLSCNYGFNSTINYGLLRFSIGFVF